MKRVIWLCLFSLCPVPASGQDRGGGGAGFGRGGFGPKSFSSGSFGHGRFRGSVVIGGFNNRFGFQSRFFPSSAFFPFGFPIFGGGYDYGNPSAANIIVIQQPAPQMIVQQAREVVQPEIHNYQELPPAGTAAPPTATGEEATFVIALNNGARVSAAAVWVQDSMVHYVDTDDRHHHVPLKFRRSGLNAKAQP